MNTITRNRTEYAVHSPWLAWAVGAVLLLVVVILSLSIGAVPIASGALIAEVEAHYASR